MTNAACKTRWQQGLYDADYRKQYNGGWFDLSPSSSTATIAASGATWQAHFYDPDTGKNYKGNTSPTAKTERSRTSRRRGRGSPPTTSTTVVTRSASRCTSSPI